MRSTPYYEEMTGALGGVRDWRYILLSCILTETTELEINKYIIHAKSGHFRLVAIIAKPV